jgi:hypothetical protein
MVGLDVACCWDAGATMIGLDVACCWDAGATMVGLDVACCGDAGATFGFSNLDVACCWDAGATMIGFSRLDVACCCPDAACACGFTPNASGFFPCSVKFRNRNNPNAVIKKNSTITTIRITEVKGGGGGGGVSSKIGSGVETVFGVRSGGAATCDSCLFGKYLGRSITNRIPNIIIMSMLYNFFLVRVFKLP